MTDDDSRPGPHDPRRHETPPAPDDDPRRRNRGTPPGPWTPGQPPATPDRPWQGPYPSPVAPPEPSSSAEPPDGSSGDRTLWTMVGTSVLLTLIWPAYLAGGFYGGCLVLAADALIGAGLMTSPRTRFAGQVMLTCFVVTVVISPIVLAGVCLNAISNESG